MGTATVERESRVTENACGVPFGSVPSSSGLVESAVNLPGPSGKPKYFLVTDSELVP